MVGARSDSLSAESLMQHVRALADDIGPRPAGTPREARAQAYVRAALQQAGFDQVETLHFGTPMTWTPPLVIPTVLALVGNLLSGRIGRLVGGLVALYAAYSLWRCMNGQRTPLAAFAPANPSTTQIARVPAAAHKRHTLVFIGHVDANKHRLTFSPAFKPLLPSGGAVHIAATGLNGALQLVRAVGPKHAFRFDYRLSLVGMLAALLTHAADDAGPWVDGANDNATAVACLLGLAAHLKASPLPHTEVWFAFTGAEETGLLGTHALLDAHGAALRDAFFFDFEMVGAGSLAYVTHHSGFAGIGGCAPDAESVALAAAAAAAHPDCGVTGTPMTLLGEVAALRGRGFRAVCLVGVGEDGFPVNWHQSRDTSANIVPATLEKAARYGLAYAQAVDQSA